MENKVICLNKPIPTAPIPKALRADERHYNVWTLRFTAPHIEITKFNKGFDDYLDFLTEAKQVKLACVFRESSRKRVLHYHIRLVTTWKTRPSILKQIKKSFIHFGNKGNKMYQTHKCYVDGVLYDKSLLHSTNYIAKDGDLVYKKGYTEATITELINESKKYNTQLKLPVWKKIMLQYDIKHPSQIPNSIIEFYESIEKVPPRGTFVREICRKILWKISKDYRKNYRQRIEEYIHEEICGY